MLQICEDLMHAGLIATQVLEAHKKPESQQQGPAGGQGGRRGWGSGGAGQIKAEEKPQEK